VATYDGCEIPILKPEPLLQKIYYNGHKKFHSVKLLAAVDADGRFRDISVGAPGSVHDAIAVKDTAFWKRGEAKQLGGKILADKGFSSTAWLFTPIRTPTEKSHYTFNYCHLRTRNPIEKSFARLNKRFPSLSDPVRLDLEFVPNYVTALCALHNLAIDLQEPELIDVTCLPPNVDNKELEEIEDLGGQTCLKLFASVVFG
jgi:hypothetical protein